jgi:hypothetical protein
LVSSRKQTTTNVHGVVRRKELSYTFVGNVNLYNHYGNQYGDSSKN